MLRVYYQLLYSTRMSLAAWKHTIVGGCAYDRIDACIPTVPASITERTTATTVLFDRLYEDAETTQPECEIVPVKTGDADSDVSSAETH